MALHSGLPHRPHCTSGGAGCCWGKNSGDILLGRAVLALQVWQQQHLAATAGIDLHHSCREKRRIDGRTLQMGCVCVRGNIHGIVNCSFVWCVLALVHSE